MAIINVKVTMRNGTGLGLFVKVEEETLFFDSSGVKPLQNDLSPKTYVATIGGNEPSSSTTLIQFIQEGNVIGEESFTTPTFFGFIPFTVI